MFVGKKDSGFNTELERHLKIISVEQQSEKKALFYTAKKYEALARELGDNFLKLRAQGPRWKSFYADWKKQAREASTMVASLNRTPGDQLTYPDEFSSLRAATEQLAVQGKNFDSAVVQSRDLAATQPLPIVREFTRLKQEAASITARP
jgi:hypothetical protein